MLPRPLLILSAFYFLLSTFTLPAHAAEPPPPLIQISGDVADPTGKPLPNAIVTASGKTRDGLALSLGTTRTDASGKFILPNVDLTNDTDLKDIYAILPGVGVTKPARFVNAPVHLQLAPSYDVQLTMLQEDGTPAVGVEMHLAYMRFYLDGYTIGPNPFYLYEKKPYPLAAVTDVDGKCLLQGMPRNAFCFVETDDPRFARLGPFGIVTMRSDGPLAAARPKTLASATSISGRLLTENGQPEAGRLVKARTADTDIRFCTGESVTDANGNYTINQLAPGNYLVCVDFRRDGPTLSAASPANVTTTINKPGVLNFTLTHGGIIKGQARDSLTGSPLAGISLGLYFGDWLQRGRMDLNYSTDKDGRYEIRVPPGAHHLFVRYPPPDGYLRQSGNNPKDVTLEEGQTVEANFELQPDLAPLIEGTVVDPAGKPLPGAWIGLDSSNVDRANFRLVWTDAQGHFHLHALPDYLLRAGDNDLATPTPIKIMDDKPLQIKLSPDAKFTLIVQISDEEGKPISQASANLVILETSNEGSVTPARHADAQGNVRYGPLRKDGKYSLSAIGDDYRPREAPFDLTSLPADAHELTIPVTLQKATGEIAGDVVDDDGKPLPNIAVTYTADVSGEKETTTNAQGHFSFHVGEHETGTIYPHRDLGPNPPPFPAKAGETALNLTLPKSTP